MLKPQIKKISFTPAGFEDLKIKLSTYQKERPGIISELKRAREMGDLSENGFYKSTKGKLYDTDRQIRHLTFLIKNAKIEESHGSDTITIGNNVTLDSNGESIQYQIVGTYESDPSAGKISQMSPLGRKLIGKKADEEIELQIGEKKVKYKIKKIT